MTLTKFSIVKAPGLSSVFMKLIANRVTKVILMLFLFTNPQAVFGDVVPKTPVAPPIVADTILSITNLTSHHDSARINEIIAIKIRTVKDVSVYNTLYINGIKVNGLRPWKTSLTDKVVYFKLNNNVQQLGEQFLTGAPADKVILPVLFSIGDPKQSMLKYAQPFQLEVKQTIGSAGIYIMSVILLLLLIAALRHNVLKDDNNLYYSLGRTQLLFWTMIVSMAYLYLCNKTGTLPDIPASVLIIIGISAATTAASKVLENSHKDVVPIDPGAKSEGFFLDILSDGSSINIQRFQNVVFNLLFGIIFVQKVISSHLMPDFDNNVLLMMGISAGTYAGLKTTEATKEQNKPAAQVNSDNVAQNAKKAAETTGSGPSDKTVT